MPFLRIHLTDESIISIRLLNTRLRSYIYSAVVRSHTHVNYVQPFTCHFYQYTDTEDNDIYSSKYEHSDEKPYKCNLETHICINFYQYNNIKQNGEKSHL